MVINSRLAVVSWGPVGSINTEMLQKTSRTLPRHFVLNEVDDDDEEEYLSLEERAMGQATSLGTVQFGGTAKEGQTD